MADTALLVLAKAPVAGHAKTRMIPGLGAERAASLQAALIRDALARTSLADANFLFTDGESPLWDDARALGWHVAPQAAGDLGDRLAHALESVQARLPRARATIIGTDAPSVPDAIFRAAFESLRTDPLVLGPAFDGGYYIIGTSVRRPPIFEGIRWSSEHTLADTLTRCAAVNLRPALLPWWYDLDIVADLERLALHCASDSPLLPAHQPPSTLAFYRAWLESKDHA